MEFADFAVEIEKVLSEVTSQYECAMVDDNDIGVLWNFLYEDSAEGFLLVEKDSPPFQIPTITITIHLGEITGAPVEFLKFVMGMNMVLVNSSLAIINSPVEDSEDKEADEENLEDNERDSFIDELVLTMKMPYEAFIPAELLDYLNLLVAESDFVTDALDQFSIETE